ncbi:hypothetical protein ABPG74_021357 [Tetrahymena malaccensis]
MTEKKQIENQGNLYEKLKTFLWKDIKMEGSVSGSHLISNQKLYIIRYFFLLYCISVFIVGLTEYKYAFFENLLYLTNWGLFINISYFYLTTRIMKDKDFEQKYWKVAYVLFEIGFSIQLVIFGLYWTAIYATVKRTRDFAFFYQSISEHGGMYAVLIVDKIFNNIKFCKRHLLYLFAFMFIYLTYNLSITMVWQPIYPIICWTKPLSFYLASGAVLVSILHFTLGKLYYDLFKHKKIEACSKEQAQTIQSIKKS